MQLPLSASALVMLGVAAVLIGALILVVVVVRRRKPASGTTRLPPDVRMHQRPVGARYLAATPEPPAVGDTATRPHVPALLADQVVSPASAEHVEMPAPAGFPPEHLAGGAVAAAATARPMEVTARVDPPGEPGRDEPVPPAQAPATAPSHQAGSARTVAAAVAQAFAVRAAAGRAGASGPGIRRPPGLPPAEAGARESAPPELSPEEVAAAPAFGPDGDGDGTAGTAGVAGVEPDHDVPVAEPPQWGGYGAEQAPGPDDGQRDIDDGDPAAATDPDGLAMTAPVPDDEPRTSEVAAPEAGAGGLGRAATAVHASNGDGRAHVADHAPDGRPVPDGVDRDPASTGWTALPVPVPADPEPAAVPVQRPWYDGAPKQGGSATDARDRLLAVLLDDPERAVGAVVELEACILELERLSDAVRKERASLRDVLHRLAAAGLRPEQLSRLAGMPLGEVEALLEAAPARVE